MELRPGELHKLTRTSRHHWGLICVGSFEEELIENIGLWNLSGQGEVVRYVAGQLGTNDYNTFCQASRALFASQALSTGTRYPLKQLTNLPASAVARAPKASCSCIAYTWKGSHYHNFGVYAFKP